MFSRFGDRWRSVLGAALLLIILVLVGGCAAPIPTAPAVALPTPKVSKLRLCTSGTSGAHAVAWYALERGLFARHGLDVSIVPLGSGTMAATALLAGDVDVCQIAGSSVVNAVVAGGDLAMFMGYFNTYPSRFMVLPFVNTPDDLRGKSVGISQFGSVTDTVTRQVLRTLGLEPDRDVTILAVGDEPTRLAAMESGRVAASLFLPPTSYTAREKGYHELLNFAKLGRPVQFLGAAASRSALKARRPDFIAFAQAMSEAMAAMRKDPDGVKAVIASHMGYDGTAEAGLLDETYQILIRDTLATVPYPTLPGLQSALDELSFSNPKARDFKPEQAVDLSIVKELEDSGFYASLEGKQP